MDITIFVSSSVCVATFLLATYRYFDTHKRDQTLKEFEIYHKLIKELVKPDEKDGLYLDRQTAIIYELKNYKKYYPFSYRTLVGLKDEWSKLDKQFPRLFEELNLAIKYLKKYRDKF